MRLPFGIFCSLDDMFDSLLLILSGMFLMMFGGCMVAFVVYI